MPLVVLDDVNAIFDDLKLSDKFSSLIQNLLARLDETSCNSIFLSYDTRCCKQLRSIQGMSERIEVFHFGELEEESFNERIEQEEHTIFIK